MSVDDIVVTAVNNLQTIHRAITGVRKAPALSAYPTVMDTADLPMIITWPGEATWHHKGSGGGPLRLDETMEVVVFIEPLGVNDVPTRAVEAARILQRIRNAHLSATNIPLADPTASEPYQITIESSPTALHHDTGLVSNLMYGGKLYHGFRMQVRLRVIW